MKQRVEEILLEILRDLSEETGNEELINPSAETRLFGTNGVLDSLSLVSFVADVEEALDEAFGVEIVLADEKAMSRKTSPFRSVEILRDYIIETLNG